MLVVVPFFCPSLKLCAEYDIYWEGADLWLLWVQPKLLWVQHKWIFIWYGTRKRPAGSHRHEAKRFFYRENVISVYAHKRVIHLRPLLTVKFSKIITCCSYQLLVRYFFSNSFRPSVPGVVASMEFYFLSTYTSLIRNKWNAELFMFLAPRARSVSFATVGFSPQSIVSHSFS